MSFDRVRNTHLVVLGLITATYLLISFRLLNSRAIEESQRSTTHAEVNENSPLIFIGGVPRSGITLLRAMLDAHPDVRCGEETKVIPELLQIVSDMKANKNEWTRLQYAGVTGEVIGKAVASFIIQVIANHGAPALRLCDKDPYIMQAAAFLAERFPNARFLFVIRDGRATVHSMISQKVKIGGFNITDYRECLKKWNEVISKMDNECTKIRSKCLRVHYEQLVLHPEPEMRRILDFLEVPWNRRVLYHEDYVGKDAGLLKFKRSSDQVVEPVNTDALSKWVEEIPEDVVKDMETIAPMLRRLGYDPNANPPNYGTPDEFVAKKTEELHKDSEKWYKRQLWW